MNITVLLLLAASLQVSAKTYAQAVTLSETNAPLEKVFKEIEKQTGYSFVYTNKVLQNARTVTLEVKNSSLQEALELCFKDQPLSWSIVEKIVVVTPKEVTPKAPPVIDYLQLSGTVVSSETGDPLAGASIAVKGTSIGTKTDENGRFSISIEPGQTLVISFVGYEVQEIKPGNKSSISIDLKPSLKNLSDVVVTALGVKRDRRSLGYATSTVKGEDLVQAGVTLNPALALYGRAAGVGVSIGSAGPTGGVNIRIRGAAGLESNAKTRPLFVVDGVPIYDEATTQENKTYDPLNSFDYGSGINDINPEDIESMEILKGAKATVLYGSQGLNGVVLITTKSGKRTRGLGITVSQQMTIEKPVSYIDFQNEYGSGGDGGLGTLDTATTVLPNGQRVRKLRASRYSFGPKFDGSQVMRYDSLMVPYMAHPNNFIDFFNTGHSNRTNVAISGGGPFGSARASFSHVDYTDILPNSTQKNNTFSFNGNFKVSPFASFEFISNIYSISTRNRRPNLEQVVAWGLNRDYDYNFLKDFYLKDGFLRQLDGYALPPNANPPGGSGAGLIGLLWQQNNNKNTDNKFHTVNSIKSTLNFTKEVSLVAQASIDYTNTDYIAENQIRQLVPERIGGSYKWTKRNTLVQNYQALLNYEKAFRNDQLRVFAFAGGSYQQVSDNSVFAGTGEDGLVYPGWFSLANENSWPGPNDKGKVRGATRGSDLLYGVFGSITTSWKNTYYLEIQARNDWNSTLPPSGNSYFYPGLSFTYNFTNDFTIPKLKYGKLRFAWADVGGGPSTALNDRYFADNSYSVSQVPYSPPIVSVAPPSALFLEPIKPFRKREFEAGLNTRWLEQSRLEVDFSFYTNNIYNEILSLPTTAATGYSTARINSGNTKHWGYELFIKAAPLVTDKFRWELTFTAARELSKIVTLYPGIHEKIYNSDDAGRGFRVEAIEGQPGGQIQMFDYKRDPSGNRIVTSTGGYVQGNDFKTFGNVNPKAYGGLYSDFFLKGFNFHIGIDYKYGGTIFSYSNNYLMGNGVIKATLPNRDQAHGGLAYYIDKTTGANVLWQHNSPAPAASSDGLVHHDGMVLDGVKEVTSGSAVKYEKNDIIIGATSYYQSYINDAGGTWPPDRMFKNDYIKLREISVDYTIPKKISNMLKLQKLSVNLAVRNLGYLYKTLPNVDAESALSAQGYVENSFYPSLRSYSFGINVSF